MTSVRERIARWSRMKDNEKSETGMRSDDTAVMETDEMKVDGEEALDGQAGQVDMEAGTESGVRMAEGEANEAEIAALREERDLLRDRLARLQAEFDNARKREGKEKQDARDFATQNAIEPFLGVMDNFGLALKAQGSVEQLRSGVELIVKQMDEALRGLNVQPVESVGAQFDPRVHEALGSVETVEHPDHQVLEEIRRGYKLRDKLLRPALVKIAVNPAQVSE